jgi:predicted RNA binding protein YcfA (HicA-like mRNA interferase family)
MSKLSSVTGKALIKALIGKGLLSQIIKDCEISREDLQR